MYRYFSQGGIEDREYVSEVQYNYIFNIILKLSYDLS